MSKPFKTYEEQINILKSRGLIFDDETNATRLLEINSYYSLINGYKEPFIIKGSDNFKPQTRFDYIYKLFNFDKRLSHSILDFLLEIETMLKAIISYEFSNKFGENGYLDINHYNNSSEFKTNDATKLVTKLDERINECYNHQLSTYNNIRHYKDNHGYVPLWVLFTHLYLNDISQFYDCCDFQLRIKICKHISSIYGKTISNNDLYIFLRILVQVRNICAHNQRLYNFTTKFKISQKNPSIKTLIDLYGTDFAFNNVISVLIIAYHLCAKEQLTRFISGFIKSAKELLNLPSQFIIAINEKQSYNIYNFIDILFRMIEDNFVSDNTTNINLS